MGCCDTQPAYYPPPAQPYVMEPVPVPVYTDPYARKPNYHPHNPPPPHAVAPPPHQPPHMVVGPHSSMGGMHSDPHSMGGVHSGGFNGSHGPSPGGMHGGMMGPHRH